jgi:PTS system cellobiose-specific IIB component
MKVFLVCSGGMSTSYLVQALKKAIQSQNLNLDIEAIPITQLPDRIQEASAILIAPQIRHQKASIESWARKHSLPFAIMDGKAFGTLDVSKILDQVQQLLNPSL